MGKSIPLWQAMLVLFVLLLSLFWEIFFSGAAESHIALITASVFACIIAVLNGWQWDVLEKGILRFVSAASGHIVLIILIGIMYSVWTTSGIIPSAVSAAITYIPSQNFLCTTFIICSFISLFSGYSWAVAGTLGIFFINIGIFYGYPAAMIAGAVVSGSYVGEKLSPVSMAVNMQAAVSGVSLYKHIRYSLVSGLITFTITLITFYFLGRNCCEYNKYNDYFDTTEFQEMIYKEFFTTPLFLLIPAVSITISCLRRSALPGIFFGIIAGTFCLLSQGIGCTEWLGIMSTGSQCSVPFSYSKIEYIIGNLFSTSGFDGTMWSVSLILCAMVLGGILYTVGIIDEITAGLIAIIHNTKHLILLTAATCFSLNVIASDQYLSVLVPGVMYKKAYSDSEAAPENLSRCLGDAGAVTSSLIPWSGCGIAMTSILGIPVWGPGGYGPYAVFCWLSPIITLFITYTGISYKKNGGHNERV